MRKLKVHEVEQMLSEANQDNQFSWDLSEYQTMNHNIPFICNKCNKTFKRKPTVFVYQNNTCPYCNGKARNIKYTTEELIEKAKEIHGDKYDYSQTIYEGTDKKVKVICHEKDEFGEEHGEFAVTPHAHIGIMHSGCPKCSQKYGSQDLFLKKANKLYGDLYSYSNTIYKGALHPILITCKKHGDFLSKPNWFLNGKHGCPKCNQSLMEQDIEHLLTDNNIEHIYYASKKHLEWLDRQSLDFYLPQYNIAIECQGEQHFKPVKHFNQKVSFEELKERDIVKYNTCNEHGIKILYYTNLNKYIDNKHIFDKEHLLNEIKQL